MMRSLRFRLLVAMMAGVVVVIALFGAVIYASIRGALVAEIDQSLLTAAQSLAATLKVDHGKVEFGSREHSIATEKPADLVFISRVWLDGELVRSPRSAADEPALGPFCGSAGAAAFRSIETADGRPLRAVGLAIAFQTRPEDAVGENATEREREALRQLGKEPKNEREKREWERNRERVKKQAEAEREQRRKEARAAPPVDHELTIVIARDSSELLARLSGLRWLLIGAGAGTVLIGVGITLATLHRGLVPLTRVAAEIAALKADDLAAQLSPRGLPSEMAPIVERLNDLLGRVAAAFSRERAFAADAAHELRTPVAGLRTTLEVALATSPSAAEQREALADALHITLQMQSLVENLLTLTRLESGHIAVSDEPIDLAALIDECWRGQRQLAVKRGLKFENRLPEGLTTRSDKTLLGIVFANLLQNASQYTNEGGRVWVDAGVEDGWLTATVANTGCTLARDQLGQVFERFWRGDAARSWTGLHAGLGLALVQRIVTALGGRVEARLSDDGVFSVCAVWKQPAAGRAPNQEQPVVAAVAV